MNKNLWEMASQNKGAREVRRQRTEGEASREKRKGEGGRAKAPGEAEGQRSIGLSLMLGMAIFWLLAASEWQSRAVPQPSSFVAALAQSDINFR